MGDFREVCRVLRLLEQPFSDDAIPQACNLEVSSTGNAAMGSLKYDGPVPEWATSLCVSCSS